MLFFSKMLKLFGNYTIILEPSLWYMLVSLWTIIYQHRTRMWEKALILFPIIMLSRHRLDLNKHPLRPLMFPHAIQIVWYDIFGFFFKGHALGRTNDIQTQFIYVLYNKYAIVLIFYFLFLLFAARRPSSSLTVWGKQQ